MGKHITVIMKTSGFVCIYKSIEEILGCQYYYGFLKAKNTHTHTQKKNPSKRNQFFLSITAFVLKHVFRLL